MTVAAQAVAVQGSRERIRRKLQSTKFARGLQSRRRTSRTPFRKSTSLTITKASIYSPWIRTFWKNTRKKETKERFISTQSASTGHLRIGPRGRSGKHRLHFQIDIWCFIFQFQAMIEKKKKCIFLPMSFHENSLLQTCSKSCFKALKHWHFRVKWMFLIKLGEGPKVTA